MSLMNIAFLEWIYCSVYFLLFFLKQVGYTFKSYTFNILPKTIDSITGTGQEQVRATFVTNLIVYTLSLLQPWELIEYFKKLNATFRNGYMK